MLWLQEQHHDQPGGRGQHVPQDLLAVHPATGRAQPSGEGAASGAGGALPHCGGGAGEVRGGGGRTGECITYLQEDDSVVTLHSVLEALYHTVVGQIVLVSALPY